MVEKELPFTHKPAEAFTKLKKSVSGVNYLYTKALFPTEKDREAALNAESWAEENAQEIHPNDLLRQIGRQFGFRPLVRLLEYRYPSVQGSDDVTKRSVLYETALQENSKLQSHAFNIELGVEKP